MKLTKLRLAFDKILGYNDTGLNHQLWSWVKEHASEIAELNNSDEELTKIRQYIWEAIKYFRITFPYLEPNRLILSHDMYLVLVLECSRFDSRMLKEIQELSKYQNMEISLYHDKKKENIIEIAYAIVG